MLKNINKLFLSGFFCAAVVSAEPGLVNRDLFFLPLKGEFQSKSQFNFESRKRTYGVSGFNDYSSSSLVLSETLSYSLYDDLIVKADVGFKTLRDDSSKSYRTSSSGLLDPSFSIFYRINDQSYSPVFFDMSLAISPSFGKHDTNNVLRGSSQFEFTLDLGQEIYAWAYKLSLYSVWFSKEVTSTGSGTIVDSRFDLGGKVAVQYDVDPEWAANFELGLRIPGKRQKQKSNAYENSSYELSFLAGPVYQYNHDLSGALNFYTKYEKGTENSTANKSANYKSSAYGINLALDYVF
jgi:hypothetical protein